MNRQLAAGLRMFLALTLVLGVLYPVTMTLLGRLVPTQSQGSLIIHDDKVLGSWLLCQETTDARWFQARPSASQCSGETSGGSNAGPSDPALVKSLDERRTALVAANPQAIGEPPADALTASASGLDPHVSAAYALWQVPRVAAARSLSVEQMAELVRRHIDGRTWGFLGEERVNVNALNEDLATRR